jgi:hypothetical protein
LPGPPCPPWRDHGTWDHSYFVSSCQTGRLAGRLAEEEYLDGLTAADRAAVDWWAKEADMLALRMLVSAEQTAPLRFDSGATFALGLGHRVITGPADNHTRACGANDMQLNLTYQ